MSTPPERLRPLAEESMAESMGVLVDHLLDPAKPQLAIEELCKRSATKAVNEVLGALFLGAHRDPFNGVITMRHTSFSEQVVERIVRQAIDGCCEMPD